MKNIIRWVVLTLMLTLTFSTTGQAMGTTTVLVNGEKVNFPDQKPYIDENNRTMVPVRFVAEALGANVDWNGDKRLVTIDLNSQTVKLWIGNANYSVGSEMKRMDTKPVIKSSRTMVPLRFTVEALGASVGWDAATRTVDVVTDAGYDIPKETDLGVEIEDRSDNPHNVDIDILISMYKPLEPQFKDLQSILSSKFGPEIAKEITDYARQKTERNQELPDNKWTINEQLIWVGSNAGSLWIDILIYLPS